jgi:hypothetical protein
MTTKTASSTHPDPHLAAQQLLSAIGDLDSRLVVFFASAAYSPAQLGEALASTFGEVPSIGCTTAGELVSSRMLKKSVVLVAFDGATLRGAHVALIPDMKSEQSVSTALTALGEAVGQPVAELDPEKYVGLVLHDGLSVAEETVMSRLSARTNVPFVGGSAGDDVRFERTHVFVNFEPHVAASALALLEPTGPYGILKTQSFEVLDRVLEVTEVDETTRTVRRFNGKPAANEYAAQLGVSVSELPDHFRSHPVGLVMGDGEPYVRSPQRLEGTDVVFYCQVKPGMKLHVLQSRDIVDQTREDLNRKLRDFGPCGGIINFHCILRTLELEAKGQCDDYAALFEKIPMVGFSTYGESYVGHINQTSTMVLLP